MSAPLNALAVSLDIGWGAGIERVEHGSAGWRLVGDGLEADGYDALVTALPAEQTVTLLKEVAPDTAAVAQNVPSLPCWTVMAAFRTASACHST